MWEKERRGVINMLNWCASLSGFVANTNRASALLMNSMQMDCILTQNPHGMR